MTGRQRILVVDDDEGVLFVLAHALGRMPVNYQVITARTGIEALCKARSLSFDLMITDIRLPDMDGIQLTEMLLVDDRYRQVIWITAFAGERMRKRARELGVFHLIDKPIEITEIRRVVLAALASAKGTVS